MNRDSMFELRVLTGTHCGARALLAERSQLIGSGDNCALILSDEGVLAQHACLEQQADGSTLLRWLDGDLPPLVIRPGQGAQVGPVRIAVERTGAPWRDDVPLVDPALPEPTPSSRLHPPAVPVQRSTRPRTLARRVTACTLAVGLLALAAWPVGHALQSGRTNGLVPAQAVTPARPAGPVGPARDALEAGIAQLGLLGRVRIDRSDPQRPVVTAGFLPEDELLALSQHLARLSPRPRLVSLDDEELVAAVTQAAQAQGEATGASVAVQYLGAGRFRVQGQVDDEARRIQVITGLEQAFPMAAGFESALTTRADAAAAMLDDLRRQAVGRISGEWVDGSLDLEVKLPPGGQERWERAVVNVAAKHALPFRAHVLVEPGPPAPQAERPPWSVRSVAIGPLPHVTLSDGRKLAVGAETQGWKLREIRPRALVLEDARGARITMEL